MELYQFYKTDDSGSEKTDSGEYILLSEEAMVNGIKMPKVRAWYYNKDNKYLGTDTLVKNLGSSICLSPSNRAGTIRSTILAIGFTNHTNKNVFAILKVV